MDIKGNYPYAELGVMVLTEKDEFCEQIRLCENAMYALAFSVVKNDADAAEIMSESVFRAYTARTGLKSRKAFKAWILKIVHNTAVEYIRKESKTVELSEGCAVSDTEESSIASSLSLREAVKALPQPYRTAIVLFYYESLSASQIARITDSTPAAVRKQLSRGRSLLRESLKEDFANE